MKYSFEFFFINFFKILKYSFEVRDINKDFAKTKYFICFCVKIIYIVFFLNIFICLLCNLNEEKFDLFYSSDCPWIK